MDESDADLLAATARGDGEAFGRFYRRHEHRVLSYAITRCANAADVADVVGDTFLAALGAAARFRDDDGDAIPWLFGIARRVLAHQRRSFARRQRLVHRLGELPSLDADEAEAVEAAIDASRLAPRLAAAMATLRDKDRELLRLVSGDGLSAAQAGAVLGMNANTARIRLSRARARLLRARPLCRTRPGPRAAAAPARREQRADHHPRGDPARLGAEHRFLPCHQRRRHPRRPRAQQGTAHLHGAATQATGPVVHRAARRPGAVPQRPCRRDRAYSRRPLPRRGH